MMMSTLETGRGKVMQKDTRYKGYWIRFNPLNDSYIWIEKDGAYIASAESYFAAKEAIDGLVS